MYRSRGGGISPAKDYACCSPIHGPAGGSRDAVCAYAMLALPFRRKMGDFRVEFSPIAVGEPASHWSRGRQWPGLGLTSRPIEGLCPPEGGLLTANECSYTCGPRLAPPGDVGALMSVQSKYHMTRTQVCT